MHEHEPNFIGLAESFTKERNLVRAESLQKLLPATIDTQRLMDFLSGDTVSLVRQRINEYPRALSGMLMTLGPNLRDRVRVSLSQLFGNASYLRNEGGFLADESETLYDNMNSDQSVLQQAYWDDHSILLGDHLGALRINAVGYKLINEPNGPLELVVRDMVETDVRKRLVSMQEEIETAPGWLERKGLPKDGPAAKSDLDRKIEQFLLAEDQHKVDELIAQGVDPKIAEARVLAEITQPQEATPESIAFVEKRLVQLKALYPQLAEEHTRLRPHLDEIVGEMLNETALEHILQIRRFGLGNK